MISADKSDWFPTMSVRAGSALQMLGVMGAFDGHRHCLGGIVLAHDLIGFMTGQAPFVDVILTLFNWFALVYSHGFYQGL
jgi:hypothetical protein